MQKSKLEIPKVVFHAKIDIKSIKIRDGFRGGLGWSSVEPLFDSKLHFQFLNTFDKFCLPYLH